MQQRITIEGEVPASTANCFVAGISDGSADRKTVEHATRQCDDSWLIWEAEPGAGRVTLDTLRLELPLADIYERVELA